ncbi:MAG: hypothetical protein PHW50_02805 [Patescibacteria group bacterium]|nr:hypothetical protein [Patescibacteria group bacterium]
MLSHNQIAQYQPQRLALPMSKEEEAKHTLRRLIAIAKGEIWPLQTENQLKPLTPELAQAISLATNKDITDLIFLPFTYENLSDLNGLNVCKDYLEFFHAYIHETWFTKEKTEFNTIWPKMSMEFSFECSAISHVEIGLPIFMQLLHRFKPNREIDYDNWQSKCSGKNLRKIAGNLGSNVDDYLEYLVFEPQTARKYFQSILRDVWPWCIPFGHLIDEPNKFLVFCAPNDLCNLSK